MKKTISYFTLFVFVFIAFSLETKGQTWLDTFLKLTEREHRKMPLYFSENPGNNNKYYYDDSDFTKGTADFHAHFKYKDSITPLRATNDQISVQELTGLYKSLQMSYEPSSISLLKMIFGRWNDKLVIFYQPVVFPRRGGGNSRIFEIKNDPSNHTYYWVNPENNKFVRFLGTEEQRDSIIKNYTQSSDMYIIHNSENTKDLHQFVGLYTPSGVKLGKEEEDVSYCLFPFQQLAKMMERLKIKNDPDPVITFSIVASNYFYWGRENRQKTKNYKLHVIAHYYLNDKSKPITLGSNNNLGADFTQMPPSEVVTINLNGAN